MKPSGVKAIGLYGGSFDPVHLGHLRTALEVYEALALDELRFVPAAAAPQKPPPSAPATLRKRWLERAIEGTPGLTVDDRELRRGGVSFTSATLDEIRAEEPGVTLYWVLGSDAFAGIGHWHETERLGQLAHWVVLPRPGCPPDVPPHPHWASAGLETDPHRLVPGGTGGILVLPVTPIGISSSDVRARIRSGRRIDYLVPEVIRRELVEGCWYGSNPKTDPD